MNHGAAAAWSRMTAIVVAAAFFMEQLDANVLFIAMPSIARDFGVPTPAVTIATTTYLVTSAAFIPLGGWLAARLGTRLVFCASIGLFALASLGCALSPDLAVLTVFRAAQGVGGALMVPIGRLVVLRTTGAVDLIRATAYLTWPALAAPVLAPVIGGFFASTIGWRWIFVLNIPIALGVLVFALLRIRDTAVDRVPLDRMGLVLTTVALFGLILGMDALSSGDGVPAAVFGGIGAGATGLAVWHLMRARTPLFDLRVLRIPTFRAGNSGGSLYRLAIATVPFVVPLMLQEGFGYGAAAAGAIVSAIFIGNIGIKPVTTPMLRAWPFRSVLLLAAGAGAALLVVLALLGEQTPIPLLFVILLASGAFRSIGFTAYNTIQFADVPREELHSANTLSALLQRLATVLGVAIASTVIQLSQDAIGPTDPTLPFRIALLLMAAITVLSFVSSLTLRRDAGDELRGPRTAKPRG